MLLKDFKCFDLTINRINKKFKLPYLVNVYQKLENQDNKYIYKLRKIGKKVKLNKGEYYLLLAKKKLSLKTKLKIIDKIFALKDMNETIGESIWFNFEKMAIKKTTTLNYNEYIYMLDVLSMFLISDGLDHNVLDGLKVKRIKKYEIAPLVSNNNVQELNTHKFVLNKTTKEKVKNFQQKRKKATKRWKSSNTYKLNKILRNFDKFDSSWSYVNTHNSFTYKNKNYCIEDDVIQYKVKNDNKCEMDFILVLEDNSNKLFFFNMNMESIDNKKIIERND